MYLPNLESIYSLVMVYLTRFCVYWKLWHAAKNQTWNCNLVEWSKSENRVIYILFIHFFVSCFFGLYEYNQWRSVIFTIEITQRWIRGIAVFCKIVVFQGWGMCYMLSEYSSHKVKEIFRICFPCKFIQIKSSIHKNVKHLKTIKAVID